MEVVSAGETEVAADVAAAVVAAVAAAAGVTAANHKLASMGVHFGFRDVGGSKRSR